MTTNHRLGLRGNWLLPPALVTTANQYGFVMQKHPMRDSYRIIPRDPEGSTIEGVLPASIKFKGEYTLKEVREILSFLYQPFVALSKKMAEETVGIDEGGMGGFNVHAGTTVTQQALARVEQDTLSRAKRQEEKAIRTDLHAMLNFLSRGRIKEPEAHIHNNCPPGCTENHGDLRAEEEDLEAGCDECEVVSDDMREQARWENDGEIMGGPIEGLSYDVNAGKFRLEISYIPLQTTVQKELRMKLFESLREIEPEIRLDNEVSFVHLSGRQLERLSEALHDIPVGNLSLMPEVVEQEESQDSVHAVHHRKNDIEASEALPVLRALKPLENANPQQRMEALEFAMMELRDLVDSPEMRRIRRKFEITKGDKGSVIDVVSEQLSIVKNVIDSYREKGSIDFITAESIVAEHHETIGYALRMVHKFQNSLGRREETALKHQRLEMLESILRHCSIAPTTIAREHLNTNARKVERYYGRHVGIEGINLKETWEEFLEDFTGDIGDLILEKWPYIVGGGLAMYFLINSGDGIDNVGCQKVVEIDPITDLPVQTACTQSQAIYYSCHRHVPAFLQSVVKYEDTPEFIRYLFRQHCIASNYAEVLAYNAWEVAKAPMLMVIHSPEVLKDMLSSGTPEGALTASGQGFKDGLAFAGWALPPLNAGQNAGHYPWFATEIVMASAIGAGAALRRTSILVTPFIDASWALTHSKPLVTVGAIATGAMGYSVIGAGGAPLGVSGVVTGATLGMFPGFVAHGAIDLIRGAPNLPLLRKSELLHSLTKRAATKRKTGAFLDSRWGMTGEESGGEEEYDRYERKASSGLFLPKVINGVGGEGVHLAEKMQQNSVSLLSEAVHAKFTLKIGGEDRGVILNADTHKALTISLNEFLFLLETRKDKIGFEDDSSYTKTVEETVQNTLSALREYGELSGEAEGSIEDIKPALQKAVDVIVGAQLKHIDESDFLKALEMGDPSRRQEKELPITINKLERRLKRNDGHAGDWGNIVGTAHNGWKSLSHIKENPTLVPTSVAYKTAKIGVISLKAGFREAWYQGRQGVANAFYGWNTLGPQAKGAAIVFGAATTALCVTQDNYSSVHDALAPAGEAVLGAVAGTVEETGRSVAEIGNEWFNLGVPENIGEDVAATIRDMMQGTPDAVSYGATFTGTVGMSTVLFAIYNFGEDHLVVHVALGCGFILATDGSKKLVYNPAKYAVGIPTYVMAQATRDGVKMVTGRDIGKLAEWSGQAGQKVAQYSKNVVDYEGYLARKNTQEPESVPA